MTLRILVINTSRIVCGGMRAVLDGAGLHVVAEACTLAEVPAHLDIHTIVIPCAQLTEPAFEQIDALRRAGNPARVVGFSTCRNRCQPCHARDDRLDAHLAPDCEPEALVRSVRFVAQRAAPDADHCGAPSRTGLLSERELEVLRLASQGLTNLEIARAMYVSEATVKSYLARIYRKLSANCRVTALLKALHEGYLRL